MGRFVTNGFLRVITLLTIVLTFGVRVGAQGISEYDRLRLENMRLRQANDSLSRALHALKGETVFLLWDELSGLDEDKDSEYDYMSGFGLEGTRTETEFMKKVMGSVPSLTVSYDDIFEKYIDLYIVSRKKSMPFVLGRYRKYLPEFRAAFAKYGVPEELTALAIVESAVSKKAVSRVGAVGIWQLMPDTARQYGLTIGDFVDERLDVKKATDVAARMLRDLKRNLGTWDLAVLAYNCGAGNVRKAIIRSGGSRDVWDIYEHLPAETRAYLPSFVGARYCERYADEYNITVKNIAGEPACEEYRADMILSLEWVSRQLQVDSHVLSELNLKYYTGMVPAGRPFLIPKGLGDLLTKKISSL